MGFARETLKNPWHFVISLWTRGLLDGLPDEVFLKLVYRGVFNKKLNLKEPHTFNEKLQWLKLHDRKDIYTTMVDKFSAKEYVAKCIGEEYIIPTLGVWDRFEDINFAELPNQFVLKCTHDSGGLVICKNKNDFDKEHVRQKIEVCQKRNFYRYGREWPYKNVKPRIIAEKYMEDSSTGDLKDYKFFCFGGQVKCFKVDFDRFIEHHANYYDREGNTLHFGEAAYPPKSTANVALPKEMEQMEELAEKLAREIPFLRADFYDINGKIYFGKLTFYPASGFGKFTDEQWDGKLGEWIELPGGGFIQLTNSLIVVLSNKKARLNDYKFFCFDRIPEMILVCSDRFSKSGMCEDFYDESWRHLPIKRPGHNNSCFPISKPTNFEQMKYFARKLSHNFPFLRVDFYEIEGKVFFGELTFYPASGLSRFEPEEWDLKLGEKIDLSSISQ